MQRPEVDKLPAFAFDYFAYRISHGYRLTPWEQLRYDQCRRSTLASTLVNHLVFSVLATSVVTRMGGGRYSRLIAFATPAFMGVFASADRQRRECGASALFYQNSPLAWDVRTAARRKWADHPAVLARLRRFDEEDAKAKGTGLPILVDVPQAPFPSIKGAAPLGESPMDETGSDSARGQEDIPSSDVLEDNWTDAASAGKAKRPLVAINVNDRTLASFPPGRFTVTPASPPSYSTSTASPSLPSLSPSTPSFPASPSSSAPSPASSPAVRPSMRDDGDDLFDDAVLTASAKKSTTAREDARQSRRDQRKAEADKIQRDGRPSEGGRKRFVRRNEFGDEIEDG